MDLSSYLVPNRMNAIGSSHTGESVVDFYSFGPAFCGLDAHAFIMPSYSAHKGVYASPPIEALREAGQLGKLQKEQLIAASGIPGMAGISWSSHRDKIPIMPLGRITPVAFVGSHRTVAGSLLFWLTDSSPIQRLLTPEAQAYLFNADELPPFDLFISFMNETGNWASCVIKGITLLDEGTVVEQAMSEGIVVTYSYMAMSCTPIMPGYFSLLPRDLRDKIVASLTTYSTKLERAPQGGPEAPLTSSNKVNDPRLQTKDRQTKFVHEKATQNWDTGGDMNWVGPVMTGIVQGPTP